MDTRYVTYENTLNPPPKCVPLLGARGEAIPNTNNNWLLLLGVYESLKLVNTQVTGMVSDKMCMDCGVNPTKKLRSGRVMSYCSSCANIRNNKYRAKLKLDNTERLRILNLCSQCGVKDRHRFPDGTRSRVCIDCKRKALKARRNKLLNKEN